MIGPAAAAAAGARMAERQMDDRCVITHTTGQVVDEGTGQVVGQTVVRYRGPCRMQVSLSGQRADAGETTPVVLRPILQMPIVGTAFVARGDLVEITHCPGDPSMVGRRMRVRETYAKTHAIMRRLTVEEIT